MTDNIQFKPLFPSGVFALCVENKGRSCFPAGVGGGGNGGGGIRRKSQNTTTDSQAPVPQTLRNQVLLPDEWDVVRTYKDIKTDAHQLRRSQEDVPMGAGDGFLKLLAPHLPVGGAEKARKPQMQRAAGREHPSPTANPSALHLPFLQVRFHAACTPKVSARHQSFPWTSTHFFAFFIFVVFSCFFNFGVGVRLDPRALCMLGQETATEHPQPSFHFLRQ